MSAIAGIYHQNHEPVSREHIHAMMGSLEQFPADDVRVYKKDHIFLGCHAQWITPESIGEILPFYDNERKLAITADAIIDNRKDLFNTLGVRQSVRKEMSDSELILLAYEKWEEDCPKHLVGDFAFVIWDERKGKIFAARDFSGARTLYYSYDNQCFAFCTVMSSLLSLPFIKREINEEWLAEFLVIQNMIDVADVTNTIHKNINQIPPAHSLTVENGQIAIKKYCRMVCEETIKLKNTGEYVEAFREVFQEAVENRTRTFSKVGAKLSGGLDSSSVVSFAARSLQKQNKRLHTYSYVPEEGFLDWTPKHRIANETPLINETIQHVGNVESNFLDFKGRSSLTEIDEWLDIMEMPYKFFENSFWLKGIFENANNDGVKILLNGGRGNLGVSWGPAIDYYATLLRQLKWRCLSREINLYSRNLKLANKKRLYLLIARKSLPSFLKNNKGNQDYRLPSLVNPALIEKTNVLEKLHSLGFDLKNSKSKNAAQQRKEHFEKEYTWNASGTSGCKLSLRYNIWKRDPTNDSRVIKFCLSVPKNQFVQNGLDRALIRNSTKDYLPDEVRLNQRTRGIQGADWLYRMLPEWTSFIDELKQLTNDPLVSEYVDLRKIQSGIDKHYYKPTPDLAFHPELRSLMRTLIVYRFIKKQFERG
ncbi:asparagine synthase-related protein [Rossellomorea sp. LjRoot5]|uniref:asparagine synthase-related protein n=1 Tax=Rossellomorea sp. LjRoot5 TaxID=3342331 RepID=UPI003ED046B0